MEAVPLSPGELARETKADLRIRRWQLRQMLERLATLDLAIERAERLATQDLAERRADLELAIAALERLAARDLAAIKELTPKELTPRT